MKVGPISLASGKRIAAAALYVAATFQTAVHGQVPADPPGVPINQAVIPGMTGQRTSGAVSVNVASGSNNEQLRSLVIATGVNGVATGSAVQSIPFLSPADPSSLVTVGQGVFKDATGAMSLNVAAGNANQQANLGLLAIGFTGIAASDALLSQTRASEPQQPDASGQSSSNTAVIPNDPFGGTQGLVQVNVTAGNRNSSANIFALTAAGGNL